MTTYELQGVVFDKDGTLIDYHETWSPLNLEAARCAAAGNAELMAHLLMVGGVDPDTGRTRGGSLLAACDAREIAQAWIDAGAVYGQDALERAIDAIFRAGAQHAVPVADIGALFARLRARGLAIGVATSDSEDAVRATLARLGIATDDIFVAGYNSGHGSKPTPGMVEAFCAHNRVEPRRVAVVGDNLHDLRMGRAAGCALCIGVLTGTSSGVELGTEADHVLDSVAGLEALLDGLGRDGMNIE